MSKQELIDRAVEQFKGKLPLEYHPDDKIHNVKYEFYTCEDNLMQKCWNEISAYFYCKKVCSITEFQQRARELGWINGYKWGVEYPTNGKKPDLPDDIVVMFHHLKEGNKPVDKLDFTLFDWFKIVDTRYKPVEQLVAKGQALCDKIEEKLSAVDSVLNWYDYSQQKPIARPPVGEVVLYMACEEMLFETRILAYHPEDKNTVWHEALSVFPDGKSYSTDSFTWFKPLDYATKYNELEKKRVVDAVMKFWTECPNGPLGTFREMYDVGFLKLPESK
jgi:hypothetical protein